MPPRGTHLPPPPHRFREERGPLAALSAPRDPARPTDPSTPGCYPHPLPHSSPEHGGQTRTPTLGLRHLHTFNFRVIF